MRENFKAPWSLPLKLFTLLVVLASISSFWFVKPITVFIILSALCFCGAFYIVGYRVTKDALYIDYFWRSKIWRINELQEATVTPNAMNHSLRIFGTGIFSSVGYFYNSELGWFYAYGTDPKLSVVLQFGGKKIVVVTPDDPAGFVDAINKVKNLH